MQVDSVVLKNLDTSYIMYIEASTGERTWVTISSIYKPNGKIEKLLLLC